MKSKNIFTLLIILVAAQSSFASTSLKCSLDLQNPDLKFFDGCIQSFDLKIKKKSVAIEQAKLSPNYLDTLKGYQNPSKEVMALIRAGTAGFTLAGVMKPYTDRQPKTPRTRYVLNTTTIAFSITSIADCMPEADHATLFIYEKDGVQDLKNISIEYGGSQGPYYDQYICR